MKVLYFGCYRELGHYLRESGDRKIWDPEAAGLPWGWEMDGAMQPGGRMEGGHLRVPNEQPEGLALLHHKAGWTALAFWDRSVDRRGGCCSVFFADQEVDFNAIVAAARETWPEVWERFTFEVRLAGAEVRA